MTSIDPSELSSITIEVITAPAGFTPKPWPQASVYPPIQRLVDGRVVVDRWLVGDVYHLKVWTQPANRRLAARQLRMLRYAGGEL